MNFTNNLKNRIPYVDLGAQYEEERSELLEIIDRVLVSGQYVGGEEVDLFEKNIAKRCSTKYSVALNSGTDALTLALHLKGIRRGDEVITPPNSFVASTAVIIHLGATPVFVDVLENQNLDPSKIEEAITEKTKAIMPVHLTGRVCDMDPIIEIAKKYNLVVIEDAAQAIGSKYKDKNSGSIGDLGCFSAHPLKNLNACGDSGFLTTNDKELFKKVKSLISHGMADRNRVESFGYVSRMDNLQAAILNFRLKKLNDLIQQRRKNAKIYFENLNKNLFLPMESKNEFNSYHTFVVQTEKRDELKSFLSKKGIDTAIHYPIPIHLQPAAKKLGYKIGDFPATEDQAKRILTLPISQALKKEEIHQIIFQVNNFFTN